MNRTILIASLFLAAPPALAQSTDTPAGDAPEAPAPMAASGPLIAADAVEDARVYSLAGEYDEVFWNSGEPFGPAASAWNEIGEVENLVIDNEAKVAGVTVDVGGFLGIGEREVLIPIEDIRLVQTPDSDDFIIVTRMSREQLEEAEDIEGKILGDD